MTRRAWRAGLMLALVGCASAPGVHTESARQAADATPPTEPPPTTQAPDLAPTDPTPTTAPPPRDLINLGDNKPARPYDDLVRAALEDLERWWGEQYPELFGEPFVGLQGGVYAAYPERTEPIPGCGGAGQTTYEEINQYGAFYCDEGDFLAYDDGTEGVLGGLAAEYGPPILGVVLAHEYGHVVQARHDDLHRGLATVITEQQADCYAGAWVARAVSGAAPGVPFSDADVRTGLIAMIAVRDPLGIDQLSEGGHGTAFDRVGAFQLGYLEGAGRCITLLDEPLPLVPNIFDVGSGDGNAPFGYGDRDIGGLVVGDLNVYWPASVDGAGGELPTLNLVPVAGPEDVTCDEPAGDISLGAVFCAASGEVFFDESFGAELYDRFGDFAIGYVLGMAWSEAVQQALGSPLQGEERALLSDCLTGAWVRDIVPGLNSNGPERDISISPGDLDEAIQTALVIGDAGSADDVVGSGFEKIASFRQGVLEGIAACTARLDD